MNKQYNLINFKTENKARQYQKQVKQEYGYRPAMFTIVSNTGKIKGYKFVRPLGLKK